MMKVLSEVAAFYREGGLFMHCGARDRSDRGAISSNAVL
jgi:hypothetical protein